MVFFRRSFSSRLAMAAILAGFCSGSLMGCETITGADASAQPSLTATCQEPRPEICTKEYRPVCGLREDGSWHTYGNACTACAEPLVIGHNPGECPTSPSPRSHNTSDRE